MGLIKALRGASLDFGPMRSLRNPQFGETNTGEEITPEVALKISAMYAAHRILAGQFAQLQLKLNKRVGNGKKLAIRHSLYPLITVKPNKWQHVYRFNQHLFSHLFFNGNSFVFKEQDNALRYTALVPLQPWRVEVKQIIKTGELFYRYRAEDTAQAEDFRADQICHFTGHSIDGIMGFSLIEKMAATIGIAKKQQEHTEFTLENKAIPAGTLEVPGKLRDKAFNNVKKSMEELHSGAENSGKILVLENGAKFQPLTMTMQQLEFISDKRFTVEEISRFTGVPLTMLSDNTQSTYDNVQGLKEQFLEFTLSDYLKNIESTCNASLLAEREQEEYFFKYDVDTYLRMDKEKMSIYVAKLREWGILNGDECRNELGYDPMDTDFGKTYFRPENMAPADEPYQATNKTTENAKAEQNAVGKEPQTDKKSKKNGIKTGFSTLLEDAFCRMESLFQNCYQRESEKLQGDALLAKIGTEFDKKQKVFQEILKPILLSLADVSETKLSELAAFSRLNEESKNIYSQLTNSWGEQIKGGAGKLGHDQGLAGQVFDQITQILEGDEHE